MKSNVEGVSDKGIIAEWRINDNIYRIVFMTRCERTDTSVAIAAALCRGCAAPRPVIDL